MSNHAPEEAAVPDQQKEAPANWIGGLWKGENLLMTFCLAAMVLLPLADMVLRSTTIVIRGSSAIQCHLTLFICMIGGAIAAREGRLLSLSTVTAFLKSRLKSAARFFSGSVASAFTAILLVAGYRFVLQQKEAGNILAYGVPIWIPQAILPLGFAAIAVRLVLHSADRWKGRIAAALLAGFILSAALWLPIDPSRMVIPAMVLLLAATIFGAPIFITLGGAALILLWGDQIPIEMMPIRHYQQVTNASLPAIPMFTLAGYLLAEGGAAKRLVRVFQALVGHFRGGPAIAAVLVCAFFTSFTGASGVTILALGGLLMPVLLAARYSERNALGLLTGSGSIGLLFPPCLPVILYAIIANIDINQMFLGGILPGFLLVIAASIWGIAQSPRMAAGEKGRFSWVEARSALWNAKWELLLPVVACLALFSGYATAVEASAITALYAFIVESVIYRDLSITHDLPRVMKECGLLVGAILLILGVALGFTGYLIQARVPEQLINWVQSTVQSPLVFLLALNVFLLIVGCIMDIFSAIIVVVPLIVPIGLAFGIDPVHLGVIFLANLELGYLTPPVGMNLFLSSYRFNKPMPEIWKSIVPILIVLLAGVLLITYVPFMSTALPRLFQ
ncbi:MAG: TRAP transporter large permease subunit [Acidobacteria bacterium]|nr:TRAP transporter large permease subunit [Acidobacteriota bacterium]